MSVLDTPSAFGSTPIDGSSPAGTRLRLLRNLRLLPRSERVVISPQLATTLVCCQLVIATKAIAAETHSHLEIDHPVGRRPDRRISRDPR